MSLRASLLLLAVFLAACAQPDPNTVIGAARNGDTEKLDSLLKKGADPNAPGGVNGWTPLMHAVHKHQVGSVRTLLADGADVNARAPKGETALMMAAGYGYTEIVNLLLDAGADAHLQAADGMNALDLAISGVPDIDRFTVADCQAGTAQAIARRVPDLKLHGTKGLPNAAIAAKLKTCAGLAQLVTAK